LLEITTFDFFLLGSNGLIVMYILFTLGFMHCKKEKASPLRDKTTSLIKAYFLVLYAMCFSLYLQVTHCHYMEELRSAALFHMSVPFSVLLLTPYSEKDMILYRTDILLLMYVATTLMAFSVNNYCVLPLIAFSLLIHRVLDRYTLDFNWYLLVSYIWVFIYAFATLVTERTQQNSLFLFFDSVLLLVNSCVHHEILRNVKPIQNYVLFLSMSTCLLAIMSIILLAF
jgi:hypothetical protein